MMLKKVCLLGLPGVGKTSLASRIVYGACSEKYLPTLGVRIEKCELVLDGHPLNLVIWDIDGRHPQQERPSVLRGASGYLLVADGTRRCTVDAACALEARVARTLGRPIPFQLLLNKADLSERWEIDETLLSALTDRGWSVWQTSAKTGHAVEAAFSHLARTILDTTACLP